jgi:branched-chain amino acid aminotransferase
MSKKSGFANMSGEIVPLEDARIHVLAPAIKYASAVFEGIRGYWSDASDDMYLFRMQDHLDRLIDSMRLMRFEIDVTTEELLQWTIDTIKANDLRETAHIRILSYIDGTGLQGAAGPVGFAVTASAAPQSPKFDSGIKLGVSSWVRISDRVMPPRIKCVANYNNGRLAIMEAREHGYDNALFLTSEGKISETPGSCFFMIKNGRLITPDTSSDILESITRDTAIRIATDHLGLEVDERRVDRSEIYLADEAFVCGSRQEILPVIQIDGLPIGAGEKGEVTEQIQRRYVECVTNSLGETPAGWLMPIYAN